MSKREGAIVLMNQLGTQRVPFLFVVDFDIKRPVVRPLAGVNECDILYDINGVTNCSVRARPDRRFVFKKHPVPFIEYQRAYGTVIENLNQGNSYLLNLTFPTRIDTDLTLDDIFHLSTAKYRLLLKDSFVVFSPEIFVQIQYGVISSFPMKGTIDAHLKDAEAIILGDTKELAEHTTIVDLIRNDLSIVAKHVRLERFRYVDHIHTNQKDLLQVSSKITGPRFSESVIILSCVEGSGKVKGGDDPSL